MHCRLLAERRLEIRRRERVRVERAHALLDLERPGERGLHRHLLVERESDQERHRLLREQHVGVVVAREVEGVRHGSDATPPG